MTGRAGLLLRLRSEELGATSIFVVLLMTVLLGCAALVVDVGAIQARKAQLQDAADAAALAIAQDCFDDGASSPLGCANSVVAAATATAGALAVANLNDHQVAVDEVAFPTPDTVRVKLSSSQVGYFGVIYGQDSNGLQAAATAQWRAPAVPLPLAMAACAFPDPGDTALLQASVAVSALLTALLGPDCGLLSSGSLISNTTGTIGVVAGGWLTSTSPILGLTLGDCEYDPNLLTTLSATISKVAPTPCAQQVGSWSVSASSPQRVVLPVFDSGLDQLVVHDVLGAGDIDRYAVIDVSAYSLTGLLGLGSVPGSDPSLCTSHDGIVGDLLAVVPPLLRGLLNTVTGCQALEGTFVGFVDSEDAASMLTGVELIA